MADEQGKEEPAREQGSQQPAGQGQEEFWPWDDRPDGEDPELMALAGEPGSQSILRPILMVIVLVLGAGIISDRKEELSYFFSSTQPLDLGSITEYPIKRANDPSWKPQLPHNRYVKLEGIPSKRAINSKYKFMKLVGLDLYVEHRKGEDPNKSAIDKVVDEVNKKPEEGRDRDYFSGAGRLLAFNAMPQRYEGLKAYYRRHYNTSFCVDLTEQQRQKIAQERKDLVLRNWKKRYDAASEAERAAEQLTEQPSPAQLEEVVTSEPICVDAYLVQAGVGPRDHWWYLALCGLIATFMLVDLVLLVRWIIRFLKPRDL